MLTIYHILENSLTSFFSTFFHYSNETMFLPIHQSIQFASNIWEYFVVVSWKHYYFSRVLAIFYCEWCGRNEESFTAKRKNLKTMYLDKFSHSRREMLQNILFIDLSISTNTWCFSKVFDLNVSWVNKWQRNKNLRVTMYFKHTYMLYNTLYTFLHSTY